jgi:hypothetical protein
MVEDIVGHSLLADASNCLRDRQRWDSQDKLVDGGRSCSTGEILAPRISRNVFTPNCLNREEPLGRKAKLDSVISIRGIDDFYTTS